MESYVENLALHQQALGHQCHILTLNRQFMAPSKSRLPSDQTYCGLLIHRIGMIGTRRFFIPFINPLKLRGYSVVHVHNVDTFFALFALFKPFFKWKLFATTHGGFFHTPGYRYIKKIYFNTVTRWACRAYNALFANSAHDLRIFRRLTSTISLMPNAITPLGKTLVNGADFIYLGRLASHKNIEGLIKVFAILKNNHKIPGKLYVVGPEWDTSTLSLQKLVAQCNLQKMVTITGLQQPAALNKILKSCGFFISASRFEGFGMSMLEGMSVGLIPFVQCNQSFTELIELGGIGRVLNFDIPTEAAAQIAAYLPKVKPTLRRRARQFALGFSWPDLAANTLRAYAK